MTLSGPRSTVKDYVEKQENKLQASVTCTGVYRTSLLWHTNIKDYVQRL
jgi:hypothetical protein